MKGGGGVGVEKSTFDLVEDVVVRIQLVDVDRVHNLKISRTSVPIRNGEIQRGSTAPTLIN